MTSENNNTTFNDNKFYHTYMRLVHLRKYAEPHSADIYTERHHIIPGCMGGPDDSTNIVRFTAREHFIAHRLLERVVVSKRHYFQMKEAVACFMMVPPGSQRSTIFNSRTIEIMRKANSEASRERNMGNQHWKKRGPVTDELRRRQSESSANKRWINKNGLVLSVDLEDVDRFLQEGWSAGRKDEAAYEVTRHRQAERAMWKALSTETYCFHCHERVPCEWLIDGAGKKDHWKSCSGNPENAARQVRHKCERCGDDNLKYGVYLRFHGDKCRQVHVDDRKEVDPNRPEFTSCAHCNKTLKTGYHDKFHGDVCAQNPSKTAEQQAVVDARSAAFVDRRITCEWCDKSVAPAVFSRAHGDKCKKNPTYEEAPEVTMAKEKRAANMRSHTSDCTHCGVTGIFRGSFSQFHGDVCKENPDRQWIRCGYCNEEHAPVIHGRYHGDKCSKKTE